jgi:hypothetical protein
MAAAARGFECAWPISGNADFIAFSAERPGKRL